jgi:hypothetical protein
MPRAAVDVTPREWLGHMKLFHTNVQISNESVRTTYILMRVESTQSSADASAPAVPPHALETGLHLSQLLARVTIALGQPGDDNSGGTIRFIVLHSNLRLLSSERLRVTDCC